ncbi:MAG: hypothetical protein QOG48_803 [Verrucomicrobiota bacterium]|jgi:hypothetical protein
MSILAKRFCFLAALAAFASSAAAAAPTVTATLSSDQAAVGETVQMQVRVTGARSADVPNEIAVDGLEIRQTGTEQHFEMNNLSMTQSIVYTYTVLPMKAGAFKIPPQKIRVAGNSFTTPELTLHVIASSNRQAAPNSGGSPTKIDTSKFVTAELIVPKKTAYVGEMIPVVIRIATAARIASLEPPEITGQGFTMQKLQTPQQPQIEVINGRQWEVYTFKTAIAAVRPGKLDIGPVKANARIIVPATQRPRARSRGPFDIFDADPFSDQLFDPFGRMGERREVQITSEPVALDVKALPPNAPANFTGAIGNFTMNVEANPKSVQTGDPITVRSTITGRGNFDRMNAPALEDERGWHKYPPNSKFEKDDDVGISGTKTFEMVISPNERKQNIPSFLFAYFDPTKEQYATLRSEAIPIQVSGGAIASATPAAHASASQPQPTAAATTQTKPPDILYQLNERPARSQSFTPLFARPNFWLALIVPLLALIGLIGWRIRASRIGNREARRVAALQHEMADLMRNLRRSDVSSAEYFSNASRAVQVKTALAKKVEPQMVDVDLAATTFRLGENERAQLRRLFERSDEVRYSGARNGDILPETRREILELVESLRT